MWDTIYAPLRRFYRAILKKFIGDFLEDELQLNQVDVQFTEGKVRLTNLNLRLDVSLNDTQRNFHLLLLSVSFCVSAFLYVGFGLGLRMG